MPFVIISDLRQRHLEGYTRAIRDFRPPNWDGDDITNLPLPEYCGISVRAAVKAGWFGDSVTPDDVGELTGHETITLAGDILDAYNAANRPPDAKN